MTSSTLITVAPTGAESAKADVPALPVTVEEVAATAKDCQAIGAAVIHLHVRDAETRPTLDLGRVREVVAAVRESTDLVVQLSSGGAVTDPFDARLAVLDAEPDAASLTLGTVNFGRDVFSNPWDLIVELHTQMQQRGIVPEYEVFDLGQLATLTRLLDKYGPPHGGHVHVDLVMGVPGGMPGTAQALTACLPFIPEGASFAATGIGRTSHPRDARRAVGRRSPAGGHGGHADLRSRRAGARQRPTGRPGGRSRPHRPAPADEYRRRPTLPGNSADGDSMTSPKPAPAGGAAVDALLEPAFLENATTRPMSEVRRLRREAEQQEVNLSYTRRLLQGRLDIVRRELQRRSEHDGRSLVDLLPEILSEKGRGPAHGLGRHQTVQPHAPEEYESWVNSLTGGIDLSAIAELSDAKLEKAAKALAAAELSLSERRRGVQQVMDGLAAELGPPLPRR